MGAITDILPGDSFQISVVKLSTSPMGGPGGSCSDHDGGDNALIPHSLPIHYHVILSPHLLALLLSNVEIKRWGHNCLGWVGAAS